MPLTTSLVELIKSAEQPSNLSALAALGCGLKTHLGVKEYLAMGYQSINVSCDFSLVKNAVVGNTISSISGKASLDVSDMTRFNYQFEVSDVLNDFSDFK
jgi:hypothetical protein